MTPKAHIAVVGAGFAGLGAAHRLQCAGLQTTVFEQADYAGGRVKSVRRNGFTFDVGAFIYLGSYDEAVALMREVGLGDQLGQFPADGAVPRDGKLHMIDVRHPLRAVATLGGLSLRSRIKGIKLAWVLWRYWKHLNYSDAAGLAPIDNDSIADYCRRELNEELLDYLASVVVRGLWLSDSEYTSVGQLLWTLKNFFVPYFYGLSGGMDALPTTLARRLGVRLQHSVLEVTDRGGGVDIAYRTPTGEGSERFDGCIVAATADRTVAMYPQMAPAQRDFFARTEYIASVNTHLALSKRPGVDPTYIIVSPQENPDLCGIIADHRKATGRVPEGKGMLTVFHPHEWGLRHLDAPQERVVDTVLGHLKPYYGDLGGLLEDCEIGRWRHVVPIVRTGRYKALAAFERSVDPRGRIQLAGDVVAPVGGTNAALVTGYKAADRLIGTFA